MCSMETALSTLKLYKKITAYQDSKIREYLKHEISRKIVRLNNQLYELKRIDRENKTDILNKLIKDMDEAIVQMKDLSEELNKPFMLFSVGMGKFGKSTLINALLGCRVADVDVLPKTWKIDIYEKGNTEQALICFKSGEQKILTSEDVKKLIMDEEKKTKESEENIYRLLRNEKDKVKNTIEREELKKYYEKKFLYKSSVTEVRWPVKNSKVLNHFRIVDTPGLVQDTLGELKLSVNDYYHKADGILWMLDANKVSAQKSKELIDDLNITLAVVGGKANNVIGVLNFIDKVRKNQGEEAVNKVITEANKIFGDMFIDIIPISAKEALEGKEQNSEELIKRSGIDKLIDVIHSKFLSKAQRVQVESKILGLKGINNQMLNILDNYATRVTNDNYRREDISKSFKQDLEKRRQESIVALKDLVDQYVNETSKRIDGYTINLFDEDKNDQTRMLYVKNTIFKVEEFSNFLELKQKNIIIGFKSFIDYYRKNSIFSEYKHINVDDLNKDFSEESKMKTPQMNYDNFDTDGWSFGTNTGMIALSTIILGPLGLILSGIMSGFGLGRWIAKKIKCIETKESLKGSLNESIANIKKELEENMDKLFSNGENIVKSTREESFKSLYGNSDSVTKQLEAIREISKTINLEIEPLKVQNMILDK